MFEVEKWDDDGHFFEKVLKEGLFRRVKTRKLSKSMGKRETEKDSRETKLIKAHPNKTQNDKDPLSSNKKIKTEVAGRTSGGHHMTNREVHVVDCIADKHHSVKQRRKRRREIDPKELSKNNISVTRSEKRANSEQSKSVESSDFSVKKAKLDDRQELVDSYGSDARKRLDGSRFRWINEKLYTMDSLMAKEMFQSNPVLYEVYHRGFKAQVEKWPVNPLDLIIADVRKRYVNIVLYSQHQSSDYVGLAIKIV
jgi:hypothetical protein